MAGMKKIWLWFRAIVEVVLGIFFIADAVLLGLPKSIGSFMRGEIAYGLGSVLGSILIGLLGLWLYRDGRNVGLRLRSKPALG